MQIVCPHCSTAYQIAALAVGANGRNVRCVRCRSVWFVQAPGLVPAETVAQADAPPERQAAESAAPTDAPPADETAARPITDEAPPEPVPEQEPEPQAAPSDEPAAETAPPEATEPEAEEFAAAAPEPEPKADQPAAAAPPQPASAEPPAALADIPIPIADAPPLAPEPGDGIAAAAGKEIDHDPADIERVAARRRARAAARKGRGKRRLPVSVVVVLLALVSAAVIVLRKDIVRHFPQMASFYSSIGLPVNLRGLVFNDVKISNETHDGVPVLVVEGVIASTVAMPVEVPRLRFGLRNASGIEVYSWTAQPSQQVLEPGERLPFRTRLASPPADGVDLQVRFFTRRDAPGDAK